MNMNRDEQINSQLQNLRVQLQNILLQKENFKLEKIETENALKSIKEGDELYKIVGPIMVKKSFNELEEELKEKAETIDVMLKSLEKKEGLIIEKIKEFEGNLTSQKAE
jgi:prefoldin beta subunit